MARLDIERMANSALRLMRATTALEDWLHATFDQRVLTFGIRAGMNVVDYGCGPARYTPRFAKLVSSGGKEYAIDVQPLAIEAVKRKMAKAQLDDIVRVLAHGYESRLPDRIANMVCALDMLFGLKEPTRFLRDLCRSIQPIGVLVMDDGHESRQATLQKISDSPCWRVVEETPDHLKCVPIPSPADSRGLDRHSRDWIED